MSFSNFITLAFFSAISYMTCGLIGEIWKDSFTFGRWTDKVRSYGGIFYSSVTLALVQFSILYWCFGNGEISLPSKYLWILFGIGAYCIIFTFWAAYSYRDVRHERLLKKGWCDYDQLDSIAQMPENIGWTFSNLPQFLNYPDSNIAARNDSESLTDEDDCNALSSHVEGCGAGDDLWDILSIGCIFILRNLFRFAFAGLLISCSIVRSSARSGHSQTELYLESLREKEASSPS